VFCGVLALGAGVFGLATRSRVEEFFRGRAVRFADLEPFFDSLWGFARAGMAADEALRLAAAAAAVAVAVGVMLQGAVTAFILGVLAFAVTPRIFVSMKRADFERRFDSQFPQAAAAFSAAARVLPIRLCFGSVVRDFGGPVRTVFSYMQHAVEDLATPPRKAIADAADEFGLRVLRDFAGVVSILDEVGGGEHAGDLLDAAAEECRFKQRHRMEVSQMFGELRYTMMAATAVPVITFFIFLADRRGEYYQTVTHMPWLVAIGAAVLAAGWVIAESLVSSAKRVV
jgi:Flp pilus assembly protein TadB